MKFFLLPVILFCFINADAQTERENQQPVEMSVLQFKSSRLYGKVIDPNSDKGLEAASVQLYLHPRDSLVDGLFTKTNGDFSFKNLRPGTTYLLIISALGFEPYEQIIHTDTLKRNNEASFERDLGNIILQTQVKELANVKIVATKPAFEMSIDRKVFNVSKSLTATGGTAVDVMRNIPSVSVDIDGNVQLRNSPPLIFVDGRPTILTLDQIPADNIERVELVTNPSAKFDAASSAGIINVVLKKDKRIGLNGIASASIGVPKVLNGSLNMNLREGKINFFLSASANRSGGKARGETERENKKDGVTRDFFNQVSSNDRLRRFTSLNYGFDYFVDNRNTITIAHSAGGGRFNNNELQQQEYLNNVKNPEYYGKRTSIGNSGFNWNNVRLNYKHTFPEKGRELTADVTYNFVKGHSNSEIVNTYSAPDGSEYKPSATVRNDGKNRSPQLTFQADYVHPVNENSKFEVGLRSYYKKFRSFFNVFEVGNNGSETILPLSNNYEYTEKINAVYGTYSQKIGGFSYQVGLRAEHSKFDGLLVDSAYKFGYQYPTGIKNLFDGFFPSLFLTQALTESDQMQFNFSRRIRRPDFWQLNPFIEINDPVNLRQGNPELQPEFINSFEVNYSHNYDKGNMLGVLYWRNNPRDITQYSDTITAEQYNQLQNAAVDPNAILNTFVNASTTNRYGAEFTLQYKAAGNFDLTPSVNMQYRSVNANINNVDLSNEGFNWNAKLIANYKLKIENNVVLHNLSFQLTGQYESSQVIPQGRRLPQYGVDFALRKDFLKNNRATVTFGINDVLNSQRWGTIYDTENFYQDSYRRWNVRNFRLTFSYKFGKADFSLLNMLRGHQNDEDS
ncbi:MAG: TonB-dependent receptor [Chitinophagaceae bacterium]|nr:TonB-dependent receptor [Chitinophagaceae bacterium]